ncbi:hypothetical protein [Falsirhodobacter halotolerans]|uniref:hypothetical protein n=1 Tax=Falsirhodobacter halotolerans TaxID=1146892 RepID=UPI001FD45057|nr:hypothetical protein [Falsirhodobacter halotolerans]MCJ8139559.1 hypothetical protein [Falsirhodobacter halotolerans]
MPDVRLKRLFEIQMNPDPLDDIDGLITLAMSGAGSPLLTLPQLEELLPVLADRRLFVPSMEVATYEPSGKAYADMDLSIIGLDGDRDWDAHRTPAISVALFEERFAEMKQSPNSYQIKIWLDDHE